MDTSLITFADLQAWVTALLAQPLLSSHNDAVDVGKRLQAVLSEAVPSEQSEQAIWALFAGGALRWRMPAQSPNTIQDGMMIAVSLAVSTLWPLIITPIPPKNWESICCSISSQKVLEVVSQSRVRVQKEAEQDVVRYLAAELAKPAAGEGVCQLLDKLCRLDGGGPTLISLITLRDSTPPLHKDQRGLVGALISGVVGAATTGIIGNRADGLLLWIADMLQVLSVSNPIPMQAEKQEPPPATDLLRVFIWYSSEDKHAVRELYHQSQQAGTQPWLDEENISPGQDRLLEIRRAIERSDIILVCLTRQVSRQQEFHYVLNLVDRQLDQQPKGIIFLIPLRLEECEMPDRLEHISWTDYYGSQGFKNVLRVLAIRAKELGRNPVRMIDIGER